MSIPLNTSKLSDRAWVKFYNTWEAIETETKAYYGLRSWDSFEDFYDAMFKSFEEAYTKNIDCFLQRSDLSAGYHEDNCSWICKNRTNVDLPFRYIALDGDNNAYVVRSTEAFAEAFSLKASVIEDRVAENLSSPLMYKGWRFFTLRPEYSEFVKYDEPYGFIGQPYLTPEIFNQFKSYQQKLGFAVGYPSMRDQMNHINHNTVGLLTEMAELLREVPHKPWREIEDQPLNEVKALEELVDMIFFTTNTCFIMGWSYAELVVAYTFKMQKNLNRLTSGYSKVGTPDNI